MMGKQEKQSSIEKLQTPFEQALTNAEAFLQNIYVCALFQSAVKELLLIDKENIENFYDPDFDAEKVLEDIAKTEKKWHIILSEKTLSKTSCWILA